MLNKAHLVPFMTLMLAQHAKVHTL